MATLIMLVFVNLAQPIFLNACSVPRILLVWFVLLDLLVLLARLAQPDTLITQEYANLVRLLSTLNVDPVLLQQLVLFA